MFPISSSSTAQMPGVISDRRGCI